MSDDIRKLIEPEPKAEPRKIISIPAIISFIAGLGTYVWFFAMIGSKAVLTLALAPIIAFVAIFSGYKAKAQMRQTSDVILGKKFANIGMALGYIYIAVGILLLVIVLIVGVGVISNIANLFGG